MKQQQQRPHQFPFQFFQQFLRWPVRNCWKFCCKTEREGLDTTCKCIVVVVLTTDEPSQRYLKCAKQEIEQHKPVCDSISLKIIHAARAKGKWNYARFFHSHFFLIVYAVINAVALFLIKKSLLWFFPIFSHCLHPPPKQDTSIIFIATHRDLHAQLRRVDGWRNKFCIQIGNGKRAEKKWFASKFSTSFQML